MDDGPVLFVREVPALCCGGPGISGQGIDPSSRRVRFFRHKISFIGPLINCNQEDYSPTPPTWVSRSFPTDNHGPLFDNPFWIPVIVYPSVMRR
jgi:hypothetical protein